MIVDAHIHISDKPTGVWKHPPFTAEMLLELMDGPFFMGGKKRTVEKAVVQLHPAVTMFNPDLLDQHRYITDVVTKHGDRLAGCMVVNPHLGVENALSALDVLVKEHEYRAVKLHPTTHAYLPPKCMDMLVPIVEAAGKHQLPVIIHTGDTPFALPVLMAPLAEACPDTRIILAHMGTQKVCYADEAIYVAQKNENVYLETGWAPLPRIKEAYQSLGAGRLLLGSDCPIQEIGSQMRVVEVLGWPSPMGLGIPAEEVEKILGGNAVELFRL